MVTKITFQEWYQQDGSKGRSGPSFFPQTPTQQHVMDKSRMGVGKSF